VERPRWSMLRIGILMTLLSLTPGCDSSGVGKTYPVAGAVTLGGQPLAAETAMILFVPDGSKGNNGRFQPSGSVGSDGRYELYTNGKQGAPPGWYHVVVTAYDGRPEHPQGPHRRRPVARSLVPAKYGTAETTDLVVEVVPSPAPNAYDFGLVR
jgi:hypothetical protein